jgi:IS30 family transposase
MQLFGFFAEHVTAMNKYNTEECLKRAAECARLAEAANDPELKVYFMKLAAAWQVAAAEAVERKMEIA